MKEEVITEEVILETPSIPGDFFHLKIFGSIHVHDDYFLQSSLIWDNKKGLIVENKNVFEQCET